MPFFHCSYNFIYYTCDFFLVHFMKPIELSPLLVCTHDVTYHISLNRNHSYYFFSSISLLWQFKGWLLFQRPTAVQWCCLSYSLLYHTAYGIVTIHCKCNDPHEYAHCDTCTVAAILLVCNSWVWLVYLMVSSGSLWCGYYYSRGGYYSYWHIYRAVQFKEQLLYKVWFLFKEIQYLINSNLFSY